MKISVDEVNLLSFFEVEPSCEPEIPWVYNNLTYEVEREGLRLTFGISPAYMDISLFLQAGGTQLFALNASGVLDVTLNRDRGHELLEVRLSEQSTIWIRVKPAISIHQSSIRR
jgi:hypothetical protein